MSRLVEDYWENRCAICRKLSNDAANMTKEGFYTNRDFNCGHKLFAFFEYFCDELISCKQCAERTIFVRSGVQCPVCRCIVRQGDLTIQTFERILSSKDTELRQKVIGIYNKAETDFKTQDEFCDYQEMVEDIIYGLTYETSPKEEFMAKIRQYQRDNSESVLKNNTLRARELEETRRKIHIESYSLNEEETMVKRDKRARNQLVIELDRQANLFGLGMIPSVSSELLSLQRELELASDLDSVLSSELTSLEIEQRKNKIIGLIGRVENILANDKDSSSANVADDFVKLVLRSGVFVLPQPAKMNLDDSHQVIRTEKISPVLYSMSRRRDEFEMMYGLTKHK